jgi:hypothetical protein
MRPAGRRCATRLTHRQDDRDARRGTDQRRGRPGGGRQRRGRWHPTDRRRSSRRESPQRCNRWRALGDKSRERAVGGQARTNELLEKYHLRPLLDVVLRIYERDRDSAGSVIGSARAFRLFLFFVPLLLFVVGLFGFLASWTVSDDVNEAAGVTGTLAVQINTALTQPNSTRWIATFAGLTGMIWAGRSLSKVMVTAASIAWQPPVTTKASPPTTGLYRSRSSAR